MWFSTVLLLQLRARRAWVFSWTLALGFSTLFGVRQLWPDPSPREFLFSLLPRMRNCSTEGSRNLPPVALLGMLRLDSYCYLYPCSHEPCTRSYVWVGGCLVCYFSAKVVFSTDVMGTPEQAVTCKDEVSCVVSQLRCYRPTLALWETRTDPQLMQSSRMSSAMERAVRHTIQPEHQAEQSSRTAFQCLGRAEAFFSPYSVQLVMLLLSEHVTPQKGCDLRRLVFTWGNIYWYQLKVVKENSSPPPQDHRQQLVLGSHRHPHSCPAGKCPPCNSGECSHSIKTQEAERDDSVAFQTWWWVV